MKKLLLLFILLSSAISYSNDLPFYAQRMITDFRGVVTNGKNTLCYGDYGIITYSFDLQNWKQHNIGDKYNIMKIRSKDSIFYGVTEYSIIESTNDGRSWINKDIKDNPEIVSMAFNTEGLFILSSDGVIFSDFNLNNQHKLFDLDTTYQYKEIEADDEYLYIIVNIKIDNINNIKDFIYKYDINNNIIDSIVIDKGKFHHYPNTSSLTNLKVINNKLYLAIKEKTIPWNYVNHSLIMSDSKASNWKLITDSIRMEPSYNVIDKELYIFNIYPFFIVNNQYQLLIPYYAKVGKNRSIQRINISDTNERDIYNHPDDSVHFNEFIRIRGDTLIAVGTNKMIALSFNNGRNWKLASYFDGSPTEIFFSIRTNYSFKEMMSLNAPDIEQLMVVLLGYLIKLIQKTFSF